jgi:Ca-activated chloride channel family protein
MTRGIRKVVALAIAGLACAVAVPQAQQPPSTGQVEQDEPAFRFRSGVELINVAATVSDSSGRFVSGLRKEDFLVYEDGELQNVTHFSADRVPVSLGIVVDTSGSMAGEKIRAARAAIERFVNTLLGPDDEVFLMYFTDETTLLQGWTTDRRLLGRATAKLAANGGTAMYDAVAEAVTLAAQGQHRKKALVVISDGNDTSSHTSLRNVKQQIRESEVMVYAIGIDGDSEPTLRRYPSPPRRPIPMPFPFPPRRGPGGWREQSQPPIFQPRNIGARDDGVNAGALRVMTDDSGGRTEIIAEARDLDPATASIADELSRQYSLGYPSAGRKDGRWHAIRVEVRDKNYTVRARRGYTAS